MYYVRRGNKVTGPFAQAPLEQAYANGQLMSTHYVASGPSGPWMPADQAMKAFRSRDSRSNENIAAPALRSPPTISSAASVQPSRGPAYLIENQQYEKEEERRRAKREVKERKKKAKSLAILIATPILLLLAIFVIGAALLLVINKPKPATASRSSGDLRTPSDYQNGGQERSTSGSTQPSGIIANIVGEETKRFELQSGTATFTIKKKPPHHLQVKFNNGLIAKVDWERNSYSEFGYDIYEPVVSQDTNRLALMLTLRGIIANYLNGKYD